jgi:hypothetical protein
VGVVLALPALISLPVDSRDAVVRARFQHDQRQAVARAGGRALLRDGRPTIPGRLWWNAGALAWDLHVPLVDVRKVQDRQIARLGGLRAPAVLFAPLGGNPPDDPNWIPGTRRVGRCDVRVRQLARAGIWRVLAITPARCAAPPGPAARS